MMYQQIAWYAALFFIFLIALAFAFVYRESKPTEEYGPIQQKGYAVRKFYFLGLIAIMGFATAMSLSKLPYDSPRASAAGKGKIVDVTGLQFAWELSDETFIAGEPAQFRVTSKDVTHGFGLYDDNMKLLAQTQAMPEYTNTLSFTFEKPGTYKILCLEYCGTGHHFMVKDIVVKPGGGIGYGE